MGILRIVSISGGKDSTAMYLWALERWGKTGFRAVFADTGHEHPVTLNYLRNLPEMAGGPEVHFVTADFRERLARIEKIPTGNPYLDMLRWKRMMPSGKRQFCTTHLKLEPTRDWIESIRTDDDEVILYLGIRAEESPRRAKLGQEEFSDFYDCKVKRPLLHWKLPEVWSILEKHQIPPNPLYGNGMSRVGCFPCINANKRDLRNLPDWAWDRLKHWEREIGVLWFKPGMVPGKPVATIDDVREWSKTKYGGRERDEGAQEHVNDVPSCMSTWGACE